MSRIVTTTTLIVLAGAGVLADDWPAWRGPSGIGVTAETGLPQQWSDQSGVAWRVKLPGAGVSTPVVSGPHVYVTS